MYPRGGVYLKEQEFRGLRAQGVSGGMPQEHGGKEGRLGEARTVTSDGVAARRLVQSWVGPHPGRAGAGWVGRGGRSHFSSATSQPHHPTLLRGFQGPMGPATWLASPPTMRFLTRRFSTVGILPSTTGHLAMSGDIFACHSWRSVLLVSGG